MTFGVRILFGSQLSIGNDATGLLIFIADVWKNYLATLESGVSDSCSPTFIYKFENVDKKKMKKMTEMPRLM